MNDYPIEILDKMAEEREYAEANGLYDTIEKPSGLTLEQEMALAQAISTISDLAKETNSTVSELLELGGMRM